VFCDPGVTLRQVDETAAIRRCSYALTRSSAGDNGKLSLPGGKRETLTDGPDEPSVYQPSTQQPSSHQASAYQASAHQASAHQASAHQASVEVSSGRGLAIVRPLVQVDAWNAQRFWEALLSVSQDYSIVVVDLTALLACDWYAFSALMMLLKYTDIAGGEVRVVAGSPAIRRVLTDAGMDRLFSIFDRLADAMPHREPPREPGLADRAPA
jgi:anti-anti-sigma regulatory factor